MITSTTVKWQDIPHLLEAGFEIDIYSAKLGEAVMSKIGNIELDENGLPFGLEPKRGGAPIEKPKPQQPRPPMRR